MSKSLSAWPTPPNDLNCRDHAYPPAWRCGSFILQLNLTDRNFPEISIRALSEQEDQCGFAATFDNGELGRRSVGQGESRTSEDEVGSKTIAYKGPLIPVPLERSTTPN